MYYAYYNIIILRSFGHASANVCISNVFSKIASILMIPRWISNLKQTGKRPPLSTDWVSLEKLHRGSGAWGFRGGGKGGHR